jgi:hypothetical protein
VDRGIKGMKGENGKAGINKGDRGGAAGLGVYLYYSTVQYK